MTGHGTDPEPELSPRQGSEPATASSTDTPIRIPGPQVVPTVAAWVGPQDAPARFERLEQVGGGAEGAIFRARRVGPGGEIEVVALKQYWPPPGAPANWPFDGTWDQIKNQAWLLRGLPRTDHLVRVRDEFLGALSDTNQYGAKKAFETPFVVMEWVDGVRPDVAIRASPGVATRLGWVRDLADAVDLLHSVSHTNRSPLVHGDIKPGNCLVTPERGLVLVDTGALQLADGLGDPRGLRSPPYAAPEVLARPGERRGTATDLYSLGAVAYFLLITQAPPNAERVGYHEEARDTLLEWNGVAAQMRPALASHVMQLLAPDPADRIRTSAAQWAHELTEIVAPDGPAVARLPVADPAVTYDAPTSTPAARNAVGAARPAADSSPTPDAEPFMPTHLGDGYTHTDAEKPPAGGNHAKRLFLLGLVAITVASAIAVAEIVPRLTNPRTAPPSPTATDPSSRAILEVTKVGPEDCSTSYIVRGEVRNDPRATSKALWVVSQLYADPPNQRPNPQYYPKTPVAVQNGEFSVEIPANDEKGIRNGRILLVAADQEGNADLQLSLDADLAKDRTRYSDSRRIDLQRGTQEIATSPASEQRCLS